MHRAISEFAAVTACPRRPHTVPWLMEHSPLWQLRTRPASQPAPTLHHPYPHYISLPPVRIPCRTISVQSIKYQPFLHHPLIYAFVGLSLLLQLKQQSIIYLIASRSRRLTSNSCKQYCFRAASRLDAGKSCHPLVWTVRFPVSTLLRV